MMAAIDDFAAQVRENCEISNAHHWGVYSICGLLIRLIDLYKWERGKKPYESIDQSVMLDWVSEKEKRWSDIQDQEFNDLTLEGKTYEPFDLEGINTALEPHGYLYGAGLVGSLRTSFFLAELEESWEEKGFKVHLLGREHARDLVAGPALLQGKDIFLRKDTLERFLWGKLEEYKSSNSPALGFAFGAYGIDQERLQGDPKDLEEDFKRIVREELGTYLHHEMGEALDTVLPEDAWHDILAAFSGTTVEHFARGVKDLLADTGPDGMLDHIVKEKKEGSLGFYIALQTGYRKVVFPEIIEGFKAFRKDGDWGHIEGARKEGYEKAKGFAEKLLEIQRGKENGKKWAEGEVSRIVSSLSRP